MASLRSIASLQRTRSVRLRSSIFARLACEIFLSNLQIEFFNKPLIDSLRWQFAILSRNQNLVKQVALT